MNHDTDTKTPDTLTQAVRSKTFKIIISVFCILLITSAIFQAGVMVGFRKASYGRAWHDNYVRNFGPAERGRMMIVSMPENFPNAHGAIGKIVKVEYPTLIVEDKDETEKIIRITENTDIRKFRENATKDDLTVDSFIVVIGSPNTEGQVEAKLIRILPTPPEYYNVINPGMAQ
ncbi:MAG: hypothetical protein V4665_02910 [Patescibacteria group bacterium]